MWMTREEFCNDLKSARIYQKITLEQIAHETRIQLDYLCALETAEWEKIPFAYLKGYLGNYADVVGMNLEKVMESFADLHYSPEGHNVRTDQKNPTYANFGFPSTTHKVPSLWESIPGLRFILYIGSGILLVVVILALWWAYGVWNHSRNEPVKLQSEKHLIIKAIVPVDTVRTTVLDHVDTAATTLQEFDLSLVFSDSCYILLRESDQLLTERIFLPGDSTGWRSSGELSLTVGNPAATRLFLNGKASRTLGEGRRPAHLTVDASGIQKNRLGKKPLSPESPVDE